MPDTPRSLTPSSARQLIIDLREAAASRREAAIANGATQPLIATADHGEAAGLELAARVIAERCGLLGEHFVTSHTRQCIESAWQAIVRDVAGDRVRGELVHSFDELAAQCADAGRSYLAVSYASGDALAVREELDRRLRAGRHGVEQPRSGAR